MGEMVRTTLTAVCPLLLVASGCGLFANAVEDLNVLTVAVSPASGKGPFTVTVEVSAHTRDSRLQCFVTPTGRGLPGKNQIYDSVVPAAGTNANFTFDFTPPQAGLQQVVCIDAPGDKVRVEDRPEDQAPSNEFTVPFEASGVRSDYASDGTTHCDVPTAVTLTILPGGIAQLVSDGTGIIDHINCTQDSSGTPVSWIAAGTAADGFATFNSCNEGRFQGSGRMDYGTGQLTGAVTCSKDGTRWVTVALG